jgi:nitroreductase
MKTGSCYDRRDEMEVNEATLNRRSIRKYRSDPVDEKTLNKVLEAVRQAPSWANTQCWRLVVVRDSGTRSKLAGTLFSFPGRPNLTAEAIKIAPVAIALCAETGKSGFAYGEPKKPATDKGEYWYMYDVALAMENLALSACSFGLGTVIIGAFDPKAAAAVLNVPAGYVVVSLTPLGYPDEAPAARPRKALSEIVFYNQFGRS